MWVSAWRKWSLTLGYRTTNRLESFHQKLKSVMKSSDTLASCVETLVKFSDKKQQDIIHKKSLSQCPISYHATNLTETTNSVYASCTPFAAKMIVDSLSEIKKLHGQYVCKETETGFEIYHVTKSESQYMVNHDMNACTCSFFSTMLLPCKHIFLASEHTCSERVPVFASSLVGDRWKQDYQLFAHSSMNTTDNSAGNNVGKIVIPVLRKVKSEKALSRCQK